MKKFFILAATALLLSACSTLQSIVPNVAPDTAQSIAAAQVSYEGLASAAEIYINSGKATPAVLKSISQVNEVAHSAVASAVDALAACPVDATTKKYDSTCANGAAVQGALSTATSALQQFTTLLNTQGVSTQ